MPKVKTPFPSSTVTLPKKAAVKILLKSVVYAFAIFGILFILLLFAVLGLLRQEAAPAVVPGKAVLSIDFDRHYPEVRQDTLLTEISESTPYAFHDLIRALNTAGDDVRVKAVVGQVSVSDLGLAQIQELRQAVARLRAKGKKTYIFGSGFGSLGGGTAEYYLATAFDEIGMQPGSEAGITGIGIEVPFLKNLLAKIGVEAEFYSRYEYKTAAVSMTDAKMPKAFRENLQDLGDSLFGQITEDIAAARQIDGQKVKQLIDAAPLSAEDALQNKLIDKIVYKQDWLAAITNAAGAELCDIDTYIAAQREATGRNQTVVVVVAEGAISEGKSTDNPLSSEAVIGAETFVAQLEEIAENTQVKAVVLRINSPGGSYNASNTIWNAIRRLREERNIPVVVSMGNYAASGGYFMALAADKIVAEPGTITGSIGVLGGKMVLSGLWQKLDVNWQGLNWGENAAILSSNHSFSDKEKELFNKSLDRTYEDFTLKVSQAQNLSLHEVNKLARGRVWSGAAALKLKLVDALGGVDEALAAAKELSGIKAEEKINIVYYPKPKTLQEKISEVLGAAPLVTATKLKNQLGLDIQSLNMLKQLQYDAVMLPMMINM